MVGLGSSGDPLAASDPWATAAKRARTSQMRVHIELPDGKTIAVDAGIGDTIRKVKAQIQGLEGIPIDQQRLSLDGRQLANPKSVMYYGVQAESRLHLADARGEASLQ